MEWHEKQNPRRGAEDFVLYVIPSEAVRMGDWKGVRLGVKSAQPRMELYDLSKDPSETADVAAEHPEIVARIVEIMDREHTPSELFSFPCNRK